MAYDTKLADRIREALMNEPKVREMEMFGGICFMVNDKMCAGVVKDEMMCRIDPSYMEEALEKKGCRAMDFTHRPMKGFVFVGKDGIKTKRELDFWIEKCLAYNAISKAKKKRAAKKKIEKKK